MSSSSLSVPVPVALVKVDKQGKIARKNVEVKDLPGENYAAISHVWKYSGYEDAKWSETDLVEMFEESVVSHLKDEILRILEIFEYIWMDILCVDQTSDEVKSQQIKNMFNIYKDAQCVYVYHYGFKNIELLSKVPLPMADSPWAVRVWTLQELIVAKKINVNNAVHQTSLIALELGAVTTELQSNFSKKEKIDFATALLETSKRQCAKPIDKYVAAAILTKVRIPDDVYQYKNVRPVISQFLRYAESIKAVIGHLTDFQDSEEPDWMGTLSTPLLAYASDSAYSNNQHIRLDKSIIKSEFITKLHSLRPGIGVKHSVKIFGITSIQKAELIVLIYAFVYFTIIFISTNGAVATLFFVYCTDIQITRDFSANDYNPKSAWTQWSDIGQYFSSRLYYIGYGVRKIEPAGFEYFTRTFPFFILNILILYTMLVRIALRAYMNKLATPIYVDRRMPLWFARFAAIFIGEIGVPLALDRIFFNADYMDSTVKYPWFLFSGNAYDAASSPPTMFVQRLKCLLFISYYVIMLVILIRVVYGARFQSKIYQTALISTSVKSGYYLSDVFDSFTAATVTDPIVISSGKQGAILLFTSSESGMNDGSEETARKAENVKPNSIVILPARPEIFVNRELKIN
ncbi:hypothetical protein HK098_005083 [Nowakowskiella sp. JEL0407]|nr:hypothetical protein HK098_005083 [Nowakowskiella sp. JEL0407]